jgi:hypothetical protein
MVLYHVTHSETYADNLRHSYMGRFHLRFAEIAAFDLCSGFVPAKLLNFAVILLATLHDCLLVSA